MTVMAQSIEPFHATEAESKDSKHSSFKRTRTRQRVTRMQQATEIRKRIAAGQKNKAIIEQMRMAPRTYYRRLSALYEEDVKRLEGQSMAALLIELQALKARLLSSYRRTVAIASDDQLPSVDRLQAERLSCELSIALFRIACEGPVVLREFSNRLKELAG